MSGAIHLSPQAELAERVLLPGDPRRALLVAQELLEAPRMFNTRRGLWGYTGTAADGRAVTVQSSGIGGPSVAIVVEELITLGARTLVRVGTCGALDDRLELGTLVAVTAAIAGDGTSRALGARGRVEPDGRLTQALLDSGLRGVTCESTDLFYGARHENEAEVIEMEAAALFALATQRGAAAACVLAVTDLLVPRRVRVDEQRFEQLGLLVGQAGLAALVRTP